MVKSGSSRKTYGFKQTGALLGKRVANVSAKRGFAETRLLTQWNEIVGPQIAPHARPAKVSYAADGLGATLTLLCTGARAPEITMQADVIRDRVNACYGYNAISRVRITQTAPAGFAEDATTFTGAPTHEPAPEVAAKAAECVATVPEGALKDALQMLGQNILSRPKPKS